MTAIHTHTASHSDKHYAGPHWDNSGEYTSLESPEFTADKNELRKLIEAAQTHAPSVLALLPSAEDLNEGHTEAQEIAAGLSAIDEKFLCISETLRNYVECELAVDGTKTLARATLTELDRLIAEYAEASQPLQQLLVMAGDAFVEALCAHPEVKPREFVIKARRWWKPHLLSLSEEALSTRLNLNGPMAFANMYDNIQSTIECTVATSEGVRTMGIARANGLLQSDNEVTRRAAYEAINGAWRTQREACASVLNALSGWRTDLCARRSHKQPLHFLDVPLHEGRLERATLDAMMESIDGHRELGRRSLRLRARALGKKQLGPWDLFAPAPRVQDGPAVRHTFSEGLAMVHEAFSSIHEEMGDFVTHMIRNRWIDGSLGDKKRPGAFCTDFHKSRTPRVYMTYKGSKDDIGTLAHEIGHAFHSWVMRDLPLAQVHYPMTLAETASIFAETALSDHLCLHTRAPEELLGVAWNDVSNIDSLLLNIPARFEFEKRLYEQRPQRSFTPKDLSDLMCEAWEKYYGDSITQMNDMFWASKLHFHMADISFYNFPYAFGYLFSLGIYARRVELGRQFYPAYVALLRDTGRMSVEELAEKHLGVDLRKPDFWNQSMKIASGKLDTFDAVLGDCGL